MRLKIPALFGAAAVAAALGVVIIASDPGRSFAAPANGGPVVAELFTSQSCSSCPPAEAFFRELADRDDLIVLEWHVDYWNGLQTAAGAWKDPYSSAAWTERQRIYNQSIRDRRQVYTPQAVINGATETVGSDRTAVARLLKASAHGGSSVRIRPNKTAAGLSFDVTGAPAKADIFLVSFRLTAATRVGGGENNGRALESAHVVTGLTKLDRKAPAAATPASGHGCAVLVQEPEQGRILAGAYCPGGSSS